MLLLTSHLLSIVYQQPDPYYGHEEAAKVCTHFVTHLFACPEQPPVSSTNPGSNSPALPLFIAYALHRTRLHHSVTFAALYLLLRLKSRFPAARGSSGHRLFISAFMLASKVICDDTYSNKSWSIVGQGMFALREINQMEREMCSYLEWQLNVDPAELREFEARVRRDFKGNGPYPPYALSAPAPSPMPSTTPYAQNAPQPTFVTGRIASAVQAAQAQSQAQPSHLAAQPGKPSRSGSMSHPEQAYITPPHSPDTPETPEASHSASTSPASSVSPPTPPGEVDNTVRVVTPGGSVPMNVDGMRAMAGKVPPSVSSHPSSSSHSSAHPSQSSSSQQAQIPGQAQIATHPPSRHPHAPSRSGSYNNSVNTARVSAMPSGVNGANVGRRSKCSELFAVAQPIVW